MLSLNYAQEIPNILQETEGDSSYFFIDAWSSAATWGGDPNQIPKDGDYVVVKKGQVLLLDVDTPVLSMLLIKGMYHKNSKNRNLKYRKNLKNWDT